MANDPMLEVDIRLSRRIERWQAELNRVRDVLGADAWACTLQGVIKGLQDAKDVIADVLAGVPEQDNDA